MYKLNPDRYFGASVYEGMLVATHPFEALTVNSVAEQAHEETFRRFGRTGHNDASDAFRHCYGSALLRFGVADDSTWPGKGVCVARGA